MTTDNDAGTDKAQTIRRFFDAIVAGDSATLLEILTPDAVTRWPQSGERMTGALSCVRVHENYPGDRRATGSGGSRAQATRGSPR